MTPIVILSIMAGSAILLAIIAIVLALLVTPAALARQVHQVRLEFNDLFDQVDHFMRRDRTRKSRDKDEPLIQAPPPAETTPAERKAAIRARLFNRQ